MMKKQWKKWSIVTVCLLVAGGIGLNTFSHCQIPCGIYGDEMRFEMIKEHITTIEKGMNMIEDLSSNNPEMNTNQIVRWVQNKDDHADEISQIVQQYFLAQRVKPVEESDKEAFAKYTKQLVCLHKIIVSSMKAKQTLDHTHVENLRELTDEFYTLYFGPDHEKHTH